MNIFLLFYANQRALAAYSASENSFGKEIMQQSIAKCENIVVGDEWLIVHYWVRHLSTLIEKLR